MMQQADCSVHKAIYSPLKTYSPQIYYDTEPKPSQWWSHQFQEPEWAGRVPAYSEVTWEAQYFDFKVKRVHDSCTLHTKMYVFRMLIID